MEKPVISVLMGVYYRSDDTNKLRRSINSILEQDFSDFEFLICDDGSTEQAKAVIDSYSLKDSRIKTVRVGNLTSLPEKLNACLEVAQGEYIARMDDDDFSHPERFSKQYDFLVSNREYAFVGCNVNLIRSGETVGQRALPQKPSVKDFLFTQPYVHPALMFRKNSTLDIGGYSEEKCCRLCEDYDLLLRMYEAGYCGANLQDYLLDYTIPQKNKKNRTLSQRCDESKVRYRHFKKLGLMPKAFPYVIKPVILGILPMWVVNIFKKIR